MKEVIKFIFDCSIYFLILCSDFTIIVFGVYLLPQVISFSNAGMFLQIIMSIGVLGFGVIPVYFLFKYVGLIPKEENE